MYYIGLVGTLFFSSSVVVDKRIRWNCQQNGNTVDVYCLYLLRRVDSGITPSVLQHSQSMGYSLDKGRSLGFGNPVLPVGQVQRKSLILKVTWHTPTGRWMYGGAWIKRGIYLFISNLMDWTENGPF